MLPANPSLSVAVLRSSDIARPGLAHNLEDLRSSNPSIHRICRRRLGRSSWLACNMESGSSKAASSEQEAAVRSHSPAVAAAQHGDVDAAAVPTPSARPYYGCVFCKRGFTTAQALGGHMNVHRRDRAKPAVPLPTECTLAYPPAPPVSGGGFSMLYYAGHTGATVKAEAVSPGSPIPRELSLFGADVGTHDHDLQLGLWCHGSGGDWSRAPEGPSERRQDGELPERKLDLELRLGPRPRN